MTTRAAILALTSLLSLVACGPYTAKGKMDKAMNSWIGAPEATLVSQLGAPNLSATLGNGSKVLTWLIPWTWTSAYIATPPRQHECRKSFTITNGKVETWSYTDC